MSTASTSAESSQEVNAPTIHSDSNSTQTNEPASTNAFRPNFKASKSIPKPNRMPRPDTEPPANRVSRKDTGNTKQRVAMLFGYIGTGYFGLQWDAKVPTIEKVLEDAIFKAGAILETNYGNIDRVQWTRSSRTDKGVHALGNVIALFLELPPNTFDEDKLGLKVADKFNAFLPPEIRIFSVVRVTKKFSPREQCVTRTYNIIWPRKYIREVEFNLEAINKLMSLYHGHHDFHNFTRAKHSYRPYVSSLFTTPTTTSNSITPDTSTSETPSTAEPSTINTNSLATSPTSNISETPSTSTAKDDDDSSDDEVLNDQDAEGTAKSTARHPRGIKAPVNREDQITHFVQNNSYVRRMIDIGAKTPFMLGGEEWVPFKFVGESFAYNQIRKMLGYVLHIAQGHVPAASLPIALDSPFKISVPITPGECLFLLGGTFLDRKHCVIDLFQFLPENGKIPEQYDARNTKAFPWHELLEESATLTTPGAVVLQRMKQFRDEVIYPHIFDLYKQTNSYEIFNEGIKQDRFKITDMEVLVPLFEQYTKEKLEKKERKRLLNEQRLQENNKRNKIDIKKEKEDAEAEVNQETMIDSNTIGVPATQ